MFATRLVCSWIGAFGLVAGAYCQTYIQIGVGPTTSPSSINNAGTVAGTFSFYRPGTSNFLDLGFVWGPESLTTINLPNIKGLGVVSINDAGATTGSYDPAAVPPYINGFIRDLAGNITLFQANDGIETYPRSINSGGAVNRVL